MKTQGFTWDSQESFCADFTRIGAWGPIVGLRRFLVQICGFVKLVFRKQEKGDTVRGSEDGRRCCTHRKDVVHGRQCGVFKRFCFIDLDIDGAIDAGKGKKS
ncbi:MAG: hypothetical protein E2O54_16240 [Gammaproteobacteria bacterium]|nr:MAG: hypothetical protein E2O54_16240 [Gammaproteobacteria bacterium]